MQFAAGLIPVGAVPKPESGHGVGAESSNTGSSAAMVAGAQRRSMTRPRDSILWTILFVGMHVPMALLMLKSPAVATIHALACCLLGIAVAFSSSQPERVLAIAAYVAASEVLWRTCKAHFFYEGGKYAIAAIFALSLIRIRIRRLPWLAVGYFLLLLPSIALTLTGTGDLVTTRGYVSFNLSGPLALAMSVIYIRQVQLPVEEIEMVLAKMIGPLVGLAAVCSFATFNADNLSFTAEANIQTSAGGAPDQVSSVLGWAILALFWWCSLRRRTPARTITALLLMLFCAMQAALTFSRSGIYLGAICIGAGIIFLLRDVRAMLATAAVGILAAVVGFFVIYPVLDNFTGGKLSERYAKKGYSNRDTIAKEDLILFAEHPVLGVGPGMGAESRGAEFQDHIVAHTEFTRLLSEHGIFGAAALCALATMAAGRLLAPGTLQIQAFRRCCILYSFLFMLVTAMRVAMPGFTFGLAFFATVPAAGRVNRPPRQHRHSARFPTALSKPIEAA